MFLVNVWAKAVPAMAVLADKTEVDLDYLKTGGNGALDGLKQLFMDYLAESYQLLIAVGILLLVLVGCAAAICFGIYKHSTKVMEHKEQIIRILIAAALVAAIPTIVGSAYGIGKSTEDAMDATNETSAIEYVLPNEITMDC